MEGLKFLFLAFITIFLSIKLSIYADLLEKKTKLNSLLIGGLILASVTSFPELVTSLAAILINNPKLAVGNILGSNIFNLFIISFFDIFFFYHLIFNKITKKYFYLVIIVLMIYFFFFLSLKVWFLNLFLLSLIIIFLYLIFLILLGNINISDEKKDGFKEIKHLILKFIINIFLIIIVGVFLTLQANKLVLLYPYVSSSTVGAFLLGITTSLPEVVTTFSLIKLKAYNLAFSNIIGSNAFNFLVLAFCFLFKSKEFLFNFMDSDNNCFLKLGFIFHLIILISLLKNKSLQKFTYVIPSFLISFLYLILFYLQFS
ncbi:MAG: hypothetical protein ACOXZR_01305 [Bacilli bacterium]